MIMSYLYEGLACSHGKVLARFGTTSDWKSLSDELYRELERNPNEAGYWAKYELICCLLHSNFGTSAILMTSGDSIEGHKGILGIRYSRPLPDCTPRTYTLSWGNYGNFTITAITDKKIEEKDRYVLCHIKRYLKFTWSSAFRDAILADAKAFSFRFEEKMPSMGLNTKMIHLPVEIDSRKIRLGNQEVKFYNCGLKPLDAVQMLGALFAIDKGNKYQKYVEVKEDGSADCYATYEYFALAPHRAPKSFPPLRDW